ncbi:MAG: shikimate kinase [Flavobacteriales bacterium]|tara:strand:- start:1871 stop:2383 length:513 start_codon:yes stop_codon:yes gene_type:complete
MNGQNKIILIGFMGSGKTTLAKKLAKKLNRSFYDLDQEIEAKEHLIIPQIFEEKGEEYFRTIESEALKIILAKEEPFILSVGGGTPCFYDNMELINTSGVSIYLKYNAGILASRLINAKVKRPLIKGLNEIELKEFITNKLSERETFYKECNFTLVGNNLKVEDLLLLLQ